MKKNDKAWVVDVNMGYGHQRTTYPLKDFAEGGEVISANDYCDINEKDKALWEQSRNFYEFISRFKKIPLVGEFAFSLFDKMQQILSFYPKRDLSGLNLVTKAHDRIIQKGWGEHLIDRLSKKKIPLITSFYSPAIMAERFNYPGDIYCIICDADIARAWVPVKSKQSRIKYFAPNERVMERLKLYGIREENLFLTGYPLPLENVGKDKKILKEDLKNRLVNLDPKKRYLSNYEPLVKKYLGELPKKSDHPLTIAFAVGGAGAQAEIGIEVLRSLRKKIEAGEVKMILVAGIRKKVADYFIEKIKSMKLGKYIDNGIEIVFEPSIHAYFDAFNKALRKTDILWTKPSELSFYTGLGVPMVMAPIIGSQENFNREWLMRLGFGIQQRDPRYADQWLFDWLDQGVLAEMAMEGFIEGKQLGAEEIRKIALGE
jgi:hypothetical protein